MTTKTERFNALIKATTEQKEEIDRLLSEGKTAQLERLYREILHKEA